MVYIYKKLNNKKKKNPTATTGVNGSKYEHNGS